jgi:hypothetical protein
MKQLAAILLGIVMLSAAFTLSGPNAKTQNIQHDEPDWRNSLKLTSVLQGVEFVIPAFSRPRSSSAEPNPPA